MHREHRRFGGPHPDVCDMPPSAPGVSLIMRKPFADSPFSPWITQELIESMIDLDWPTTGRLTFYHEASHAIAAVAFGIGFNYVSVVAGHDVLGGVAFDERPPVLPLGFDPNNPDHLRLAENWIVLAFAGEAADAYRTGRDFDMRWPEAKGDLLVALAAASRLHANRGERHAVLNEMASRACPFMREPLRKDQIEAVARRLRMASELSREQVEWIMDNAADVSHGYLESESETGVDCRPGQDVPVIIEGREVGRIAVADVLP